MLGLPPLTCLAASGLQRWALMWLLAVSIYAGLKWLTWRRTPSPGTSIARHMAYLLAWPGLDARAFLAESSDAVVRPSLGEWVFAAGKLLAGLVCFYFAHRFIPSGYDLLLGWTGMIGVVFTLHFGLFHLLSCFWRSRGVAAAPLMDWPIASRSLTEFWGRRWNTAFRDLAHRFLFLPFAHAVGPRWGLLAGFLFSGLVHDAVISLPTGGGFGGPTLYFVIQPLGMLLQRSPVGRAIGLGRGWSGWLVTALVLTLPAGLLFHPPFVRNIVLPFMSALGAH